MSLVEVLLIAVGLSMDAFAVSLGIGAARLAEQPRSIFRLSFHFGLFQAMMPVLGWYAGSQVADVIAGFDHWIAFGLLAFVGGRMIKSGLDADAHGTWGDPSRGASLVMLSVATSIDAFAIGLSLAMLQVQILYPAIIIGIVTASLSLAALLLGSRLGRKLGKCMEVAGGVILMAIGLRVLLSHLFDSGVV